jgi:hypothetical protein
MSVAYVNSEKNGIALAMQTCRKRLSKVGVWQHGQSISRTRRRLMQKLRKATLLMIRAAANRWNLNRLYYWSEQELTQMVYVHLFPGWYYHCLYHACMRVVKYKAFRRMANWAIHTIPYHERFKIA